MTYIHPEENGLTVKEYAVACRVSTRTVYGKLSERAIPGAEKTLGGWRIPIPIYVPDSPYVGQLVTFGDGSTCEIVAISDGQIIARHFPAS